MALGLPGPFGHENSVQSSLLGTSSVSHLELCIVLGYPLGSNYTARYPPEQMGLTSTALFLAKGICMGIFTIAICLMIANLDI